MKIIMCADFKLYQKDKTTGSISQMTKDNFDSICTGGFNFVINGKVIPFDWDAQSTSEKDGVFHYESGYGPFFNDFEISKYYDEDYKNLGLTREEITAEFLASVTDINEFYISMYMDNCDDEFGIGDNSDSDAIFRLELLAIGFEERDTGNTYDVDKSVLEKFNKQDGIFRSN